MGIISTIWLLILVANGAIAEEHCRDRNRPIESERNDLYVLVDATIGDKLTLNCHYCNEADDLMPKIWYKIEHFAASQPREVSFDMNNNASLNKISETADHNLIINDFRENDAGLYYCLTLEGQTANEKYNYLVDLIFNDNLTEEMGNVTKWSTYYEENFVPLNLLFRQSESAEFKKIRMWNVEVEIVSKWEPWGQCEVCGRPAGEGIRKKVGLCRLKLRHTANVTNASNFHQKLFMNVNAISCHSIVLSKLFPEISNRTRIIPNFVETQPCEGICNPYAEGVNQGWKTGKKSQYKYRKTFVLAENAHLALICPESSLENVVVWRKSGKILEAGESVQPENPDDEPRIVVDTFSTLYLVGVRSSEEGNYTCEVDGAKMQQIKIFVVSKSRILTSAFLRHFIYLGFILSLTLTCYCAGLIIAFSKRSTFKGYEELKQVEDNNDEEEIDL